MSDLKKCPSCEKEVAKSAKVCPHCGKKLKMGMFLKLIIGIVVIVVVVIVAQPSSEDAQKTLNNKLDEITNATPANLDTKDLSEMFSIMGKSTKLQKENKEEEIKGKIVEWTVKVFNVTKRDGGNYRIQSSSTDNMPGTFVNLYPRDDKQKSIIEGSTGGDMLKIKGIITDTTMGSIDISPAVLLK